MKMRDISTNVQRCFLLHSPPQLSATTLYFAVHLEEKIKIIYRIYTLYYAVYWWVGEKNYSSLYGAHWQTAIWLFHSTLFICTWSVMWSTCGDCSLGVWSRWKQGLWWPCCLLVFILQTLYPVFITYLDSWEGRECQPKHRVKSFLRWLLMGMRLLSKPETRSRSQVSSIVGFFMPEHIFSLGYQVPFKKYRI